MYVHSDTYSQCVQFIHICIVSGLYRHRLRVAYSFLEVPGEGNSKLISLKTKLRNEVIEDLQYYRQFLLFRIYLEMKMGNWMIKYRGSWRPFSGFLGSIISAVLYGIFHLGLEISGIFHLSHGISGIFQWYSKFWDLGFPFWQLGFWDFINLKSHFLDFLYKLSEIFGAMRHFFQF